MKTNLSGALLIIFIVLKLVNAIDWSWMWVLSPLWIPLSIEALIGLIGIFLFILSRFSKNR